LHEKQTAGEQRFVPQPKQLQIVTLFGILLLIFGTGMFIYSLNLIEENEQILNSTEFTLDKLWDFESSLNWWKNVCATLILPLTSAFMFIGGITLSAQAIMQIVINKKLTKTNLENANFCFSKKQTKIQIKKEKPFERS